jgi:hypothetical protein
MCGEARPKSLPKKALSSLTPCEIVGAEAMSEFKFACPVCGQHITADSATAGGQIECPTCFQKIIVPQGPKSGDSTLLLSASRAAKPRPASTDAASQLGPMRRSAHGPSPLAVAVLLVLLCVAGAVVLHFRNQISKALRALAPAGTNALASQPAAPLPLNPKYPVPTNISWTLNLTNTVYPDVAAAGRIHGSGFRCEKAVLWGGLLTLDQGKAWPWDLGLALHLFARRGEELSDKTVEIPPERARAPRVVLRWKDAQQQPLTETFSNGYLLKVAFGHATNSHIPGRIYICLPDGDQSFVAGTFDAEIKSGWPPKPAPPKPPGTNGAPAS